MHLMGKSGRNKEKKKKKDVRKREKSFDKHEVGLMLG